MTILPKRILTFIFLTLAQYLTLTFILWDALWFSEIGEWDIKTRVLLWVLYWVICVSGVCFPFEDTSRKSGDT